MRPSSATSWPLPRYWEQISARRSHVTTVWYSAFPWPLVVVGGDAECPHRLAVRERAHLRVARDSRRRHAALTRVRVSFAPERRSAESVAEGHVIVIGGAEDKVGERAILSRFVALAGGTDARIAVISSAS